MTRREFNPTEKLESSSLKDIVLLSFPDKEILFKTCYSRLTSETQKEIKDILTKEEVAQNSVLRSVVKNLAVNLEKEEELSDEHWMLAGIWEFVPENQLQEWANPTGGSHWMMPYNDEAKYFLRKREQMPNSSFQSKDSSQKEMLLLSQGERKVVFDLCYSDLQINTEKEVSGNLVREDITRNESLRNTLGSLAVGLEMDKKLLPSEWLSVGVTRFIPENVLTKWANQKSETAKYFLEKKGQVKNQDKR